MSSTDVNTEFVDDYPSFRKRTKLYFSFNKIMIRL